LESGYKQDGNPAPAGSYTKITVTKFP